MKSKLDQVITILQEYMIQMEFHNGGLGEKYINELVKMLNELLEVKDEK